MSPNTHANEFIGKELKYFSQAGFDLDRIHIKVSFGPCPWLAGARWPPPSLVVAPSPTRSPAISVNTITDADP